MRNTLAYFIYIVSLFLPCVVLANYDGTGQFQSFQGIHSKNGTICKGKNISPVDDLCLPAIVDEYMTINNADHVGKYSHSNGMEFALHTQGTQAVPKTGEYSLRLYICGGASPCTVGTSFMHVDTKPLQFESSLPINYKNYIFDYEGDIPIPQKKVTSCYTLYGFGQDLALNGGYKLFCADVTPAPAEPTKCTINAGADLSVSLGTLDRTDIPTTPKNNGNNVVIKSIPVTCTGDAEINVKTQFKYTPITVNNNNVISTTNSNIGVAIIYKDAVVNNSDSIDETYQNGTTNINLGFEAVRDPKVAIKDITTGDFSADAVMVMTQQ